MFTFRTFLKKSNPSPWMNRFPLTHLAHSRAKFSTSHQEKIHNNIIVQKYGGTSLGTHENMQKVINIIKQFKAESDVIVVVSALSSENKAEGTTAALLLAAQSAVEQRNFEDHLRSIEDTHLDIIYSLFNQRKKREEVRSLISAELNEIGTFCSSLSVIREISARSRDKIIGCGERMAALLTSAVLNDQGYNSKYVNLSNLFDNLDPANPTNGTTGAGAEEGVTPRGRIKRERFETVVKDKIHDLLISKDGAGFKMNNNDKNSDNEDENVIPVVTGFVGQIENGLIKSFGRGYSDLTGALVAGAVNANMYQVWKESDGIFTGNPIKISNARLLSSVTPEEANELTSFGNEVLNPFTMNCCIQDKISIEIKNTFKPNGKGTTICTQDSKDNNDKNKKNTDTGPHGITAVCSKDGINILNLSLNRKNSLGSNDDSLSKVFELFDKYNIQIDLISTSVTNISVAIHESADINNIKLLIKELKEFLGYDKNINLKENRCVISVVGSGMHHTIGIAGKIFTCLAERNINVEMISQGSSEISISVVLQGDQMNDAIKAIHHDFLSIDSVDNDNDETNVKHL